MDRYQYVTQSNHPDLLAPQAAQPHVGSSLQGKIAVVTGGGTGIGRSVALTFAAQGARVFIFGRREAPLNEVKEHHEVHRDKLKLTLKKSAASSGGSIHPLSCDVSDYDAVKAAFEEVAKNSAGKIDILVNSAGVNFAERHSNVHSSFLFSSLLGGICLMRSIYSFFVFLFGRVVLWLVCNTF